MPDDSIDLTAIADGVLCAECCKQEPEQLHSTADVFVAAYCTHRQRGIIINVYDPKHEWAAYGPLCPEGREAKKAERRQLVDQAMGLFGS